MFVSTSPSERQPEQIGWCRATTRAPLYVDFKIECLHSAHNDLQLQDEHNMAIPPGQPCRPDAQLLDHFSDLPSQNPRPRRGRNGGKPHG